MEPSDVVLLLLGVICPPGSVALKRGLNRDFIICVALTLLFWLPGVAFSWYLIFKHPLTNFRPTGNTSRYHTLEEGLRRHSLNEPLGFEEDGLNRSEANDSRSTTMTSETAALALPPLRKSQSGRGKKARRSRKSGSQSSVGASRPSTSPSTNVLQEAARSYAMRHQQRQQSNSVKKWFVDRFYFPDPTQVPPSPQESSRGEQHELGEATH